MDTFNSIPCLELLEKGLKCEVSQHELTGIGMEGANCIFSEVSKPANSFRGELNFTW